MPGSESHRDPRKSKPSSPSRSAILEAAQRFWQTSYAGDYLGLAILLAAFLYIQFDGEPFHRMFSLDDPRIQFPHAEVERVPVFMLFIYAAGIPTAFLLSWSLAFRPDLHKTHVTLLGLAISIVTTLFITDLVKDVVGRPRPDLLSRCKPELDTPRGQPVTIDVCTETDPHTLQDGWRSFPSGHSSFSFSGLGYLALFLAAQMHCLRPRASLTIVLLCLAPLLGAALVAISRLEDYRHDVFDVTCGSLLGFFVAYFNWRRYYPSLLAEDSDEPHPSPSSGRNSASADFQRVRDEEEDYVGGVERFSIGDDADGYRGGRP